ncbi:cysteine dioxygenase family protein [Paraburkholderia sp. HD33-4]|uniref:cysteine dioxygenase family protein n=1 Tax=Paraburkholderia sp. HD33-4 TaxID=2883242 RepID=UPI001F1C8C50|nr:cysteine dioxygenase family protein [Paraburkholderia sp. HD33-4]
MSNHLRTTAFEHLPDYLKSLPDPARLEATAPPTHTLGDPGRTPLEHLCNTLDAMFEACAKFPEPSHSTFFARTMRLALADAAADPALLAPMQREGCADTYRRHLLVADPRGRYAIAALVWQPGQASPVHGHHTWCGYAVVEGKLSETIFEWDDARQCASALRVQARKRGAVSFVRSGRAAIHRLGNCSDAPAVSLHIYGVEGARIGTHVNDIVRMADTAELV